LPDQGFGDTFFVDEVFVKILGDQHFLWRDVDQDGEVVDVLLVRPEYSSELILLLFSD